MLKLDPTDSDAYLRLGDSLVRAAEEDKRRHGVRPALAAAPPGFLTSEEGEPDDQEQKAAPSARERAEIAETVTTATELEDMHTRLFGSEETVPAKSELMDPVHVFQTALALAPASVAARIGLGEAYEQRIELNAAAQAYADAISAIQEAQGEGKEETETKKDPSDDVECASVPGVIAVYAPWALVM